MRKVFCRRKIFIEVIFDLWCCICIGWGVFISMYIISYLYYIYFVYIGSLMYFVINVFFFLCIYVDKEV